ncbi:MAG: hypothetical protein EOL87_08125 [Spartobacteria bacterium]|nr:hypothetical protein [Spartobacteria bacterium]
MASSTKLFHIAGIPIKVHISLWIMLPMLVLMGSSQAGVISRLIFCIGVFASIAAHEMGHSLIAQRFGIRVTEILLLPIGGMAQLEREPHNWKEEMWISIAGPATSLLLSLIFGFVCFMIALQTQVPPSYLFYHPFYSILVNLAITNLILALFNLLPSFPMDGGRIFRAFMTPRVGKLDATRRASQIGRFMAIAFGVLGLLLPNIMLIAIAVFIYFSATAEYKAMQFHDGFKKAVFSWNGMAGGRRSASQAHPFVGQSKPPSSQPRVADDVHVSPPPYEKAKKKTKDPQNVFDDLYSKWK